MIYLSINSNFLPDVVAPLAANSFFNSGTARYWKVAAFFFYFRFPSSLGALFLSTTNFELILNFLHQFVWIRYVYTGIIYRDICGTRTGRYRSDKVKKNYLNNVLLLLDYLLINTVINRQQRLSSSNFHKIQTHLDRPILYIGLIVKYKTILILKSKSLTCGLCS